MRKNITFVVIITLLVGMGIGMAWSVGQAALTLNADSVVGDTAISLNGVATTTYALGTSTTSGTITIGGEAQTGELIIGQSSGTNIVSVGKGTGATTVDIATGATSAKSVRIGTGAVANGVNIGTVTGAASTTIRGGSGGIVFMGRLATMATSGLVAIQSAGTATTTATSNDTAGKITGGITSAYDGIGFSATYTTAPVCVISPADTDAFLISTSTYVLSTATSVVIYHATSVAASEWTYFCIKTQ